MYFLLNCANWILSRIILLSVLFSVAFTAFVLWDNQQLFEEPQNIQTEMQELKPDKNDPKHSFEELRKINDDVCAWVSVDNTNIDYPVLQGENNLTYINRDVYGNFSLAGSIYLDTRNNNNFTDYFSVIYGHHMDNHAMFGDLDLFKDKKFFDANKTATLILSDKSLNLKTLAIMEIPDNTKEVFTLSLWNNGLNGIDKFIKDNSIFFSNDEINILKENPKNYQIIALVTCSSGSTGTRTVVLFITDKNGHIGNDINNGNNNNNHQNEYENPTSITDNTIDSDNANNDSAYNENTNDKSFVITGQNSFILEFLLLFISLCYLVIQGILFKKRK